MSTKYEVQMQQADGAFVNAFESGVRFSLDLARETLQRLQGEDSTVYCIVTKEEYTDRLGEAPKEHTLEGVLKERGSRYGTFIEHANVSQDLKNVIARHLKKRDKQLTHDQQEAFDMITHKMARIINGDPDYVDSWIDIAGYAKLVADRLEGVKR